MSLLARITLAKFSNLQLVIGDLRPPPSVSIMSDKLGENLKGLLIFPLSVLGDGVEVNLSNLNGIRHKLQDNLIPYVEPISF